MPGARQQLNPPYTLDSQYRIVDSIDNDINMLVKYIGVNPHNINSHQFERLPSGTGLGYISINFGANPPPTLYVIGEGNAGGRRKSPSRKSKRKTRRARHKSRRHH